MHERISRDDVGIIIALAWGLRGTCVRRKVGCLLVDENGWALSSGYNGPPSKERHCTMISPCPGALSPAGTGLELCEAIHAEQNALLRCPAPSQIYTCYVTHSPCMHCVKMLLNTPCRRVVFLERYAHDAEAQARWVSTGREWLKLEGTYAIEMQP